MCLSRDGLFWIRPLEQPPDLPAPPVRGTQGKSQADDVPDESIHIDLTCEPI
jgi:hypothetical protein